MEDFCATTQHAKRGYGSTTRQHARKSHKQFSIDNAEGPTDTTFQASKGRLTCRKSHQGVNQVGSESHRPQTLPSHVDLVSPLHLLIQLQVFFSHTITWQQLGRGCVVQACRGACGMRRGVDNLQRCLFSHTSAHQTTYSQMNNHLTWP